MAKAKTKTKPRKAPKRLPSKKQPQQQQVLTLIATPSPELLLWQRKTQWPQVSLDDEGLRYVFIADAFLKVGQVLFGDQFKNDTDKALATETASFWSAALPESEQQRKREASQKQFNETRQSWSRVWNVARRMIYACLQGNLVAATRSKGGGSPVIMPRSLWNGENLYRRFIGCDIDPQNPCPVSPTYGRPAGDHWLMIRERELATYMAGIGTDIPRGPRPPHRPKKISPLIEEIWRDQLLAGDLRNSQQQQAAAIILQLHDARKEAKAAGIRLPNDILEGAEQTPAPRTIVEFIAEEWKAAKARTA